MQRAAEVSPVTRSFLPYIALSFGVLALSLSSLFIRWAQAPGPVTSFYRMAIAALVLLPAFLLHLRRNGLPPLRWIFFPLAGGLFTALDHGTWSTAVGFTRVANATLLNNMAPLWVALFAVLIWRERLVGRFWIGLVITMLGAAVVLGSDLLFAPNYHAGNLLALLSSIFYAAYFLITQRGRRHMHALPYVWLVTVFCALGLLIFSRAQQMPLTGFDSRTWLVFLSAALISQVGGYVSIAYALGHLPASIVSPTMISQPVLTALLAVPLVGEYLTLIQWLGCLAVVMGIYLINHSRSGAI
jgi:drug/metabolite transporter (DMT)-like permease